MADWQKGDLALCVVGKYSGRIYLVVGVLKQGIQTGLLIEGSQSGHPTGAWCASSFRKVTPPKADEFDREVIELMNGQPAEYSGKSPMRTPWWEAVS